MRNTLEEYSCVIKMTKQKVGARKGLDVFGVNVENEWKIHFILERMRSGRGNVFYIVTNEM